MQKKMLQSMKVESIDGEKTKPLTLQMNSPRLKVLIHLKKILKKAKY